MTEPGRQGKDAGFVQRELDRIGVALGESLNDPERHDRLYVAQQALCWALDPDNYASPIVLVDRRSAPVTGTRAS